MNDDAVAELEAIKRLMILLLVKLGSDSKEIAGALGVDGSVVRRLVPTRSVKKISLGEQ
jgi:hypothetical protein